MSSACSTDKSSDLASTAFSVYVASCMYYIACLQIMDNSYMEMLFVTLFQTDSSSVAKVREFLANIGPL